MPSTPPAHRRPSARAHFEVTTSARDTQPGRTSMARPRSRARRLVVAPVMSSRADTFRAFTERIAAHHARAPRSGLGAGSAVGAGVIEHLSRTPLLHALVFFSRACQDVTASPSPPNGASCFRAFVSVPYCGSALADVSPPGGRPVSARTPAARQFLHRHRPGEPSARRRAASAQVDPRHHRIFRRCGLDDRTAMRGRAGRLRRTGISVPAPASLKTDRALGGRRADHGCGRASRKSHYGQPTAIVPLLMGSR